MSGIDSGTARLRLIIAIAGGVYFFWWFAVELLLPGSFNPLPGRLLVVGLSGALLAASYFGGRVARYLSPLFTAWACLLVAHYSYLLIANHGDTTWWVGTFVTFAASSMCMQSRREVAIFSAFALACAILAATVEGQVRHAIYVPGLATILLLANITKHSQMVAQDATAQADDARMARRKSDEQRSQLAAIVESSADAIIASSLAGTIQSWNKSAERLFGYTAEEMLGQPLSRLSLDTVESEDAKLIARLETGESVAPLETMRRCKDGSTVHVSIALSPVRDSGGALVGASMSARDISDRKRAEAEVLRAQEATQAANRALEAFSYSVAHDLRAPLRSIDGFSNALLEDYAKMLDAEGRGYLRRIGASAKDMGRLIDGLLELGRITRASIRDQHVDLTELARAVMRRLWEGQPDRVVEFVVTEGLVEQGDRALLGSAIENLLGNAWKFTRSASNARIEFGSVRDGERIVYFVRDNGAGFDMTYASKLFGVFQRLHTEDEFEGTGVGLATVQRIIHRHGGRVWAEGKVGEGATFHFTFGEDQ